MKTILLSQGKWPNKSSGVRGVNWRPKSQKWQARCGINGKRVHLGYFDDIKDAEKAVLAVRQKPVPTGEAFVSDEDYEYLNQFNWHRTTNSRSTKYYVVRNVLVDGKWRLRKMHHDVAERMGIRDAETVDHENLNPLDNRRENLRPATMSEQNYNKGLTKLNTSGVKGVTWDKQRRLWYARITVKGHVVWSGRFSSLDKAKDEREKRVPDYHGEFTRC